MFSNHSFNALLKTLEEPPPHVKFLLATTDPKRLPVTVLSRCLQFNLTRLAAAQIATHLAVVLEAEGVPFEPEAAELVAHAAGGSVRDALSLLDQAITHGGGRLAANEVAALLGTVDQARVFELLDAVAAGDAQALIARARELATYAPDHAQLLGELLGILRRVAVAQALAERAEEVETEPRVHALAHALAPDECQLHYQIALTGRRDLALSPDPETGFEMVLLRMLAFRPAAPLAVASAGAAHAGAAAPVSAGASTAPAASVPTLTPASWARVIDELGLTGLVRELARNSALIGFDGRRAELMVAPQFEKLAARRHVEALQAALAQALGCAVQVEVGVGLAERPSTPSEQDVAAAAERQRQAEAQIEGDPNVQALRQAFDATIEDVSSR
jgi:DNA polymerase-3 subunit gamma/tau